jgi:small subunit ribosomal protein S6
MGHYELVILFHPYKLVTIEDALSPYLELIGKTGKLLAIESWGRRVLSYPISKMLKAEYIFLQFSSTQDVVIALHKTSRFDPLILRCLNIKLRDSTYVPTELIDSELTSKLRIKLNLIPEEEHPNQTDSDIKEEV